ncbi:hypothetical protein J1N35_034885 [Gossypium stocksii]|uniref:Uncharacterized protein n=1 Tax=Gossypium stocksii TaxID=47602 RepID=A0A9D3USW0_9ROSI|nr:hypothetical protein J1N35_034885 [Gossypium stocksii]
MGSTGKSTYAISVGPSTDMGKGILGGPSPGYSLKEAMSISLMVDLGGTGTLSRSSSMKATYRLYKLECLKFGDSDFRGWWAKLE